MSEPAGGLRRTTVRVLAGAAILFAIVQFGVTRLSARFDLTTSSLLGGAAMLACALLLERVFFGNSVGEALRALGFGVPAPRALLVAALISAAMLGFFPILARVTHTPLRLKHDWLWILAGAVALNGVAEETLFRGWVFGHLRRPGGASFGRAVLISMPIFAAVHLLLFASAPPSVALGTLFVAIAACWPMAYLFERGRDTIWAPVILHVTAHAVRLFDLPEAIAIPSLMAWILVQIAAGFLVFAFRGPLRG